MRMGNSIRGVTPTATRTYEATVADLAERAGVGYVEHPVRVRIIAVYKRPKRLCQVYKKTGLTRYDPGWLWAPVMPDADNIAKSVMDGMRAVWRDDKQVVRLEVDKVYARMQLSQCGRWWKQDPPCVVGQVSAYADGGAVAFERWPAWAEGLQWKHG